MRKTRRSAGTGSAASLVSASLVVGSASSCVSYARSSVLFSLTRSRAKHSPLLNRNSTFQLMVRVRVLTVLVFVRRRVMPSDMSVRHTPRFSAW